MQAKQGFWGITKRILNKHTAVSEAVAIAMAQEVRAQFKTDYAIFYDGSCWPRQAYGQKAGNGLDCN